MSLYKITSLKNSLQTDLKRKVDESDGRLWADSKGFRYFEMSAQTGEGITEMFQVGIFQL